MTKKELRALIFSFCLGLIGLLFVTIGLWKLIVVIIFCIVGYFISQLDLKILKNLIKHSLYKKDKWDD